jgi:hypothetical protein
LLFIEVAFEVLTAVTMKSPVSWDVTVRKETTDVSKEHTAFIFMVEE